MAAEDVTAASETSVATTEEFWAAVKAWLDNPTPPLVFSAVDTTGAPPAPAVAHPDSKRTRRARLLSRAMRAFRRWRGR